MRYISVVIFAFLIFVSKIHAQTATLRGFLYEKESGEPAIFTNVYLKGTNFGAATDVNGYFSIGKITPGTYTLLVTAVGFDTLQQPVTLKANAIETIKLKLTKSTTVLKEVSISAARQEKQSEAKVSIQTVTSKEIKQVPSVGGEPDLAQYLQVLPGVVFTGDQGGQLYIRGGTPIQNKVLLDGMIIYNPFHSIGLFSVFDADIIRNADIYTGGFNAQYGGRISSIMDITTKDGNSKNVSGKISASPFGAKGLLEGPLYKSKNENGGSATYVLSAKHSYLPSTSKLLYNYVSEDGIPYGYTDLYGKASLKTANGSKFNLFGFNFKDKVNFTNISNLNWNSWGVGSNFVFIPSASSVLIEGNFASSNYKINFDESSALPKYSQINGFNMGLNFTYFKGANTLSYGLEVLGFKTDFRFYNSVNRLIEQAESTTELNFFIKNKYLSKNKKFLFEPGFRMQYYASLGNFSPEPRLAMKFNATDFLRFKFAGGLYSQNLLSATSERDVVNLFYGFLSGPENLPDTYVSESGKVKEVTHKLQKANHLIAGVEIDLGQYLDVNIEAYQKNFTQLTNINRNKLYDDNAANFDKPEVLKSDYIIETGKARGLDFLFKFEKKRFYFWAVYSLGFVDRWDGISNYRPHFDRRHNVNLVGTYKFGKHEEWSFDARWNLGSGFPFSPTASFYAKQNFQDGFTTDYKTANEQLGILYGDRNSAELSYYHRLDINIKRIFILNERNKIEVTAGATNMYNRDNVFYFDRVRYLRVNQLPILPSLSANWTF